MQLNDNNERYYSSRSIDQYDDCDDDMARYQMQTDEMNRQIRQEARWEQHENMRWACPHGCHKKSHYEHHQYHEYKCYHQDQLAKLPEYLWKLRHAEKQLAKPLTEAERDKQRSRVYFAKQPAERGLKLLDSMPYIPRVWNIGYTRETVEEAADGWHSRRWGNQPSPQQPHFSNEDIVVATADCIRGQRFRVLENRACNGSAQECCKLVNVETGEIEIYPEHWFIGASQ